MFAIIYNEKTGFLSHITIQNWTGSLQWADKEWDKNPKRAYKMNIADAIQIKQPNDYIFLMIAEPTNI